MVEIVIIRPLFLLTFTFNDCRGARLGSVAYFFLNFVENLICCVKEQMLISDKAFAFALCPFIGYSPRIEREVLCVKYKLYISSYIAGAELQM